MEQRFSPGGAIDQERLEVLGQRQYQYTRARDSVQVTRPLRGFFGPKVVMENERSTSDAEVFPDGFRTLKLGKVVGVTTYGAVIGTGSFSLMDGSTIRTPGSGLWNINGTNLENYGVPPDVPIDNTPASWCGSANRRVPRPLQVNSSAPPGRALWPAKSWRKSSRRSSSADSASRTWNWTVWPTRTWSVMAIAPELRSMP